jgi:hypothetical protein
MFFEDFIIRQIALAAAVATKVLGLSKVGQFNEAYELIDRAIEEMLGLKAGVVKQMNDEGLVNLLRSSQFVDSDKLFALANLFIVEGDVLASQKRGTESQQSYQRALDLFGIFSRYYPDRLETDIQAWIKELRQKMDGVAE